MKTKLIIFTFSLILVTVSSQPPVVPALPPLWVRMPAAAQDGYVYQRTSNDSPLTQKSLIFSPDYQRRAFKAAGIETELPQVQIRQPIFTDPQQFLDTSNWNPNSAPKSPSIPKITGDMLEEREHEIKVGQPVDLPSASAAVRESLDMESLVTAVQQSRTPGKNVRWKEKENGLNFKAPEFTIDNQKINGEMSFYSPIIAGLNPVQTKPESKNKGPFLADLARMLQERQKQQGTVKSRVLDLTAADKPTQRRKSRRRSRPEQPRDNLGGTFSIPGLGVLDTNGLSFGSTEPEIPDGVPIDGVKVPDRLAFQSPAWKQLINPNNPLLPPANQPNIQGNPDPRIPNGATAVKNSQNTGAQVPFNPQQSPADLLSRPPAELAFGSPYDPHKFRGGFGAGTGSGYTILGTGYRESTDAGFSMPDDGVRVDDVYTVPLMGIPVARGQKSVLQVKPKDGALSEWTWSEHEGFQTLGTGYKQGVEGSAGINGYTSYERLAVPVMGWNVYQEKDGSGFDLSKFKFHDKVERQAGPFTLGNDHTYFSSPWLGNLIQRTIWDGALQSAGYTGLPGGAMPDGIMPGVPFIG